MSLHDFTAIRKDNHVEKEHRRAAVGGEEEKEKDRREREREREGMIRMLRGPSWLVKTRWLLNK